MCTVVVQSAGLSPECNALCASLHPCHASRGVQHQASHQGQHLPEDVCTAHMATARAAATWDASARSFLQCATLPHQSHDMVKQLTRIIASVRLTNIRVPRAHPHNMHVHMLVLIISVCSVHLFVSTCTRTFSLRGRYGCGSFKRLRQTHPCLHVYMC